MDKGISLKCVISRHILIHVCVLTTILMFAKKERGNERKRENRRRGS